MNCGLATHIKEAAVTANVIQYCNDAEQKYLIVPLIGAIAQWVLITAICLYEEYKAQRKEVVTDTENTYSETESVMQCIRN